MANTKAFKVKNGLTLGAYSGDIDQTAVKVFVYDTSLDSDGGAWRHRVQNTSWYNEPLNQSDRGSRREFPAVALLVITTAELRIYDLDDPTFPLWMRCTTAPSVYVGASTHPLSAVSAKNGLIVVGSRNVSAVGALSFIDFIKDECVIQVNATTGYWKNTVANRNAGTSTGTITNYFRSPLIERNIEDVAMRVDADTPVDPIRGLPNPTIIVGTYDGTSIIRSDGFIYDCTLSASNKTAYRATAPKRGGYGHGLRRGSGTESVYYMAWDDLPNADQAIVPDFQFSGATAGGGAGQDPHVRYSGTGNRITDVAEDDFTYIGTGDGGLSIIDRRNKDSLLFAQIMTDHTTGFQITKQDVLAQNALAALMSTSTEDYSSIPNLITNGGFANDSDWEKGTGWAISSGKATHTQSSGGGDIYQTISVVSGKRYVMSLTFDTTGDTSLNNISWGFREDDDTGYYASDDQSSLDANTAGQVKQLSWLSTVTGDVRARVFADDDISIDDFVVREADEDRTNLRRHLQVFGTLNRDKAASNGDISAYSNWGNGYLMQPYNPELQFGTGDFSIICWVKSSAYTNTYSTIVDKAEYGSQTGRLEFLFTTDDLRLTIGTNHTTASNVGRPGIWQQVAAVRKDGDIYLYVDGRLVQTGRSTGTVTNSLSNCWVGVNYNGANGGQTKQMALLRMSQVAPTTDQMYMIYCMEQPLFQEGVNATLYGSSHDVRQVAYDPKTNLLHAGTSSGRSVFSGLTRVDNSTSSATVALDAVGGVVADG